MDNRLVNNLEVLDYISKVLSQHPELRFTQLLYYADIDTDRDFFDEPKVTLQKLKAKLPITENN